MPEDESLGYPNKSSLQHMRRDDLIALVENLRSGQPVDLTQLQAKEEEYKTQIAQLTVERDQLSEADAIKDKHLKELEQKLAEASTLATAKRDFKLINFPGVDYTKPCYRLKWNERVEGGDYKPAQGHKTITVQATSDGGGYTVDTFWKDGYHITNDLRLARSFVALGKGISCEPVK